MKDYLNRIGLEEFSEDLSHTVLNETVADIFGQDPPQLSRVEIKKLYSYKVPLIGEDGACSLVQTAPDQIYNLAETLGLDDSFENLKNHPQTVRLWRLSQIAEEVMNIVGPDWFGIYRKIVKETGKKVLVKEAYCGAFSRAEFPLEVEFAKKSNNSTVGLTGQARHFADLSTYQGPYYECDQKVQSEYCGPILTPDGKVIGIVDAESFQTNFFTKEKILQLTKICHDLGKINLGL